MAIDQLSISLERYDRHIPFFSGTVVPPKGVRLDMFEVGQSHQRRDGIDRNTRMIHQAEFDVCEVGLAPYITAKAQNMPVTAVPVFPRRLFCHGRLLVTHASGIEQPRAIFWAGISTTMPPTHAISTKVYALTRGESIWHRHIRRSDE